TCEPPTSTARTSTPASSRAERPSASRDRPDPRDVGPQAGGTAPRGAGARARKPCVPAPPPAGISTAATAHDDPCAPRACPRAPLSSAWATARAGTRPLRRTAPCTGGAAFPPADTTPLPLRVSPPSDGVVISTYVGLFVV